MKRTAIVAAIGDAWIDCLSLDREEQRSSHCGSEGCGCRVSGRHFRAAVPREISVKTGDEVVVSAPFGKALASAFIVLGIPCIAAAAGWFLMSRINPELSGSLRSLGAVGLAGFSLFVVSMLAGRRNQSELPEIISVVDAEQNG